MVTIRDLEECCSEVIEILKLRPNQESDFDNILNRLNKKSSKEIISLKEIGITYILDYLMKEKKITYSMGKYRIY